MKNAKKIIGLGVVLVSVIGLTAGVTYALLKAKTLSKENTFTSSGNLSLELTETNWDSTGQTLAENCTPGLNIPKNPVLTNTSKVDEFVSIKLKYEIEDPDSAGTYIEVGYEDISKLVSFMSGGSSDLGDSVGLGEGWVQDTTNKNYFYYLNAPGANPSDTTFKTLSKKVSPASTDSSSNPLFKSVKLLDDLSIDSTSKFVFHDRGETDAAHEHTCTEIPNFKITATGYAVQATDITGIKSELDALMATM